jgi:hypothetical protein
LNLLPENPGGIFITLKKKQQSSRPAARAFPEESAILREVFGDSSTKRNGMTLAWWMAVVVSA